MNRKEYNNAVKQYSNQLYGYAIRFLQNEVIAQDIVQDAFEKLWINRRKIIVEKTKSWLFTTAHNTMINHVIRAKKQVNSPIENFQQVTAPEVNTFISQEVVDRAVSILPPVQKSAILLRDLEGYSYAEIGEVLNLSKSQVKVYLFRARNKVKKQLKGQVELV